MAVVRLQSEFEYILERERELPPEAQTTWLLRTLTYAETRSVMKTEVILAQSGDQKLNIDRMGVAASVLSCGLRGWRNLQDGEGGQHVFVRAVDGSLPPKVLDLVAEFAVELANAITERSVVSKEHAKN
ncbi:MAG: hypothetical protein V2A73_21350 [Pseudomonadota bacterium]